jgi:beta-phosphoglucomutase family hydrolase
MDFPRAFIFDMDGTLVDDTRFHLQAWLQLLAELGVQVTAEEFHLWSSGKTNGQILQHVLGPGLPEGEITEIAERKEARFRAAYRPHRKLVAGLDRFLREASHLGVPMAVATSAGRVNIEFILEGVRIGHHFRAIVSGEEIERGKPNPEVFLLAAQRLGVAAARCLVFEDSPGGIEAAYRAGMKAVAVTTSFSTEVLGRLPGVVQVVRDFTSLRPGLLVDPAPEAQRP